MAPCIVCKIETSLWMSCVCCKQPFCFVCVKLDCERHHPPLHRVTTSSLKLVEPAVTIEPGESSTGPSSGKEALTIRTKPAFGSAVTCSDCHCPVPGVGPRRVCKSCKHVYKRTEGGWAKTEEVVSDSDKAFTSLYETWQLQDPQTPINPCFTSSIDRLVRVPRREPEVHPMPSRDYDGFSRAPLLHFIWFGKPKSLTKFQIVFDWARLLKSPWKGVCLWLDDSCFAGLGEGVWPIAKKAVEVDSLTSDPILALGSCQLTGAVPVYFASIDKNLKYLVSQYDFSLRNNLSTLVAAINFERQHDPPFALAQLASDILRIIVLRFYGGAYFDFDITPSLYCKTNGMIEPMHVPLGPEGLLCHRKGLLNENDILFAEPRKCESVLNDLLQWMVKFYHRPDARKRYLLQLIGKQFGEHANENIQKYLVGQAPQPALLIRLAVVVEQDLHRGSKVQFPKTLDAGVATLVSLINDTVEAATYGCFAACVGYDKHDTRWDRMKKHFSEETLTKVFYSWKDPGAPKAIELIEATMTLQAAIRDYLARKAQAEKETSQQ